MVSREREMPMQGAGRYVSNCNSTVSTPLRRSALFLLTTHVQVVKFVTLNHTIARLVFSSNLLLLRARAASGVKVGLQSEVSGSLYQIKSIPDLDRPQEIRLPALRRQAVFRAVSLEIRHRQLVQLVVLPVALDEAVVDIVVR